MEEEKKISPMEADIRRAKGETKITIPPQHSDAEIVLRTIDKIMSNDNMEQKSRLIFENIRAMAQAEVLIDSLVNGINFMQIPKIDGFEFVNPSELHLLDEFKEYPEFKNRDERKSILSGLSKLCGEMLTRVVSIDGMGRDELIRLAQGFNIQLQQHQHEQSMLDKYIMGGGMRR